MRLKQIRSNKLIEGKDAPLYHTTNWSAAISIVKDNQIDAKSYVETDKVFISQADISKYRDGKIYGVSLTRDRQFARTGYFGDVVFVLDQKKLSQRYKIYTIDFWGRSSEVARGLMARRKGERAESEEFVVGDIRPLSQYLLRIEYKLESLKYIAFSDDALKTITEHPLAESISENVPVFKR